MIRRLIARWRTSGETKKVEWKHVRLALMLGGLCLAVTGAGFVAWLADTQADAEAAKFQTSYNEWKRCTDRYESGRQIANVNVAAVAHAQDTAGTVDTIAMTLDEMVAVFEQDNGSHPRLRELRELVDRNAAKAAEYQEGVDEYRQAAAEFVPQDPGECPPKPVRD